MKALPLILAALLLAGCDMKKITSVLESATPTPAPTPLPVAAPAPKAGDWLLKGYKNPLDKQTGPTPRSTGKPTPVPKQGEWMLKGYKNPLDPPKR